MNADATRLECTHLRISGQVQGVGYRMAMVQAATSLGLRGWVRNRRDGSVEALAVGDAAVVRAWVDWARTGPPGACVTQLRAEDVVPPTDLPAGFEQRPTA